MGVTVWHATCLTSTATGPVAASKEAVVGSSRGNWISWRSVSCLAMALVALPSLAQQQGGRAQPGDGVRTLDHAIEFYISDDALQAQYVRSLDLGDLGPTEVRGGFFYNEDRDLIGIADLLTSVGDAVDVRSFELRVGTRLYGAFLAPEDQDVFGIGLGGEAQYYFGSDRATSVTLGLFYSPDIVTFGESDNIKDVVLRLSTRLRGGTDVFVGFRNLELDLSPSDREADDNMHVGFRTTF